MKSVVGLYLPKIFVNPVTAFVSEQVSPSLGIWTSVNLDLNLCFCYMVAGWGKNRTAQFIFKMLKSSIIFTIFRSLFFF